MIPPFAKTENDWFSSIYWVDRKDADIDMYVQSIPDEKLPSYDLKEKLTEWQEHGVVIFKNVIDVRLVNKVLEDLEFVLKNYESYNLTVNEKYDVSNKLINQLTPDVIAKKTFRLVDLYRNSFNTALLSMIPEVSDFLSHLFLEKPALLQSLTFYRGTEQGIHQDFSFVYEQHAELAKLVACWIPLEDIDKDSGPLQYYCGSQKVSDIGFFDWGGGFINRYDFNGPDSQIAEYTQFLERRVKELNMQPSVFLPQKGDVLIWHGGLIHGGSKINDNRLTRKSHVCHYTSLSSHVNVSANAINGGYIFGLPRSEQVSDFIRPAVRSGVPPTLFKRVRNKLKSML